MRTVSLIALLACAACAGDELTAEPGEDLAGGDTTVFDQGRNAFSLTARNLRGERRDRFFVGNSLFNRGWVIAPSSTEGIDGLGPTFNEASCSSCHFKDGRGSPALGLLARLSVPGDDGHGGPLGEPSYGGQLNPKSIPGVPAEGQLQITLTDEPGTFGDGTAYTLAAPAYTITGPAFGPLAGDLMISPRVAPQMIGLGLLAAVPEADIVALADENDADGDGISGRPNRVWDVRAGRASVGRFGWKGNQPTIEQQVAGAFVGDIGITSPLFPVESCTAAQRACEAAVPGGEPEIDQDHLDDTVYYSHLLAVPARRGVDDPQVLRGKALFLDAGCGGCHTPVLHTGTLADFPEVSAQTIRPFTDLLLHDMGDALADGRPDYLADGREWRTPPLWGVGLFKAVNDHTRYLHDGRARDLTEAVLWHGGEAEAARERFRTMDAAERADLLKFLESL